MQDQRPEDFYAATREEVIPKLQAFVRFVFWWIDQPIPGFIRRTTKRGQILIEEEEPLRFTGAFFVQSVGLLEVRFSPGTVNGMVPRIDEQFIDGVDEEGETYDDGVPTLSISEGPGDRRRSYVGIQVRITGETGAIDEEDPEALTMVHRPTLATTFSEGDAPDEEGTAFWPVAQITWADDGKRIERVRQWVYFDQVHRFVPGEDGRAGRHRFRPAS